jgi:RNA polymerase sigma-70 factor (ECF subfamily)
MALKKHAGTASPGDGARFEASVMVHLDAAYNLARWLTRNERDAEDAVQEACLRAFKFLATFRGGNSRAWFLAIVRNTCYSARTKAHQQVLSTPFEAGSLEQEDGADGFWATSDGEDPIRSIEREEAKQLVRKALDQLPEEFREVIVLRELQDLSYQDIARIAQIPLGTVMSRLSRARKLLYQAVRQES